MIIGIVIIFSGFFIMTMDNEEYGYGFLGLTLGPIVVLFGFIFDAEYLSSKYRSDSCQFCEGILNSSLFFLNFKFKSLFIKHK